MSVLWTETDLIQATNGIFPCSTSIKGNGISIDTRSIEKGDIFVAIIGENSDGHAYVQKALDAGASCAIVSHPISEIPNTAPILYVKDTLQALTDMGRYARNRFTGKVIAITGSVGKTTTKEMLKTTLSAYGTVHAAAGSHNNHLGVPLTLARLPKDTDFCVCEIGMNHIGEIAPLATLVSPHIAIITEVASSHLGYMQNLDNIAKEKSQIITALPPQAVALVPETIYGLDIFQGIAKQYQVQLQTVGTSKAASLQISNIDLGAQQSNFQISIQKQDYAFTLSSPGEHLIRNAGLVIGAIHALRLDIQQAITVLVDFQTGNGRGKILSLPTINGRILDESYNASTLSISTALKTLSLLAPARKIVILGDIMELGDFSEQEHLSLLPHLIANADLVFCCGSMMHIVFEQLPQPLRGGWCATAQELIPFIQSQLQENDTLLVKGSNSMRMNSIVTTLTAPEIRKN
ncbi:UDP-N-acetylmuramoyl-tripeptide--D-alanyl-D-alanine ligase [Commensalibacter communis]|uniref:UDP-N-acetylmuramoyl-tripeptide--D-alanyl-D- alanine ligase n=1 Tax=Commensalibacter communis TaxID=2972786 RepID=UPI0022FF7CB4|nr:UDP-N-acetylmuramoyl-tripeptide--D-alanyl-D-alanine ligase [Commensalibacter communis]CAI3923357.1 UDP-N-acetylmuramyl pentapeptide synthase (MurF) (PDB:4CVK) [Commensalibacter communis]CAI3931305.1 UDP-N-acetylmuramyl pentapeptide synthase (MurF) (PDB:4CVK) [Commensalibacter communis]